MDNFCNWVNTISYSKMAIPHTRVGIFYVFCLHTDLHVPCAYCHQTILCFQHCDDLKTVPSRQADSLLCEFNWHLCCVLLSGDVHLNPGPAKHPCTACSNPVKRNQQRLQCNTCNLWCHASCESILNVSNPQTWMCHSCMSIKLPHFSNFFLDLKTLFTSHLLIRGMHQLRRCHLHQCLQSSRLRPVLIVYP